MEEPHCVGWMLSAVGVNYNVSAALVLVDKSKQSQEWISSLCDGGTLQDIISISTSDK